MCRGIAIGYEPEEQKWHCTGDSHHTVALGDAEDLCIKLEAIIDDGEKNGYTIQLDDDITQGLSWPGWITKSGGMSAELADRVETWKRKNNTRLLRYLLIGGGSYSIRNGNNDSCHTQIGGNNDSRGTKIGGNNYSCGTEVGGNNDSCCTEVGGNNYNYDTKVGGNNDSRGTEVGGNNYSRGTEVGGNNYSSYTEVGGEWLIGRIKLLSYPASTEIISELPDTLTMPELMLYCANNSEHVIAALGEDNVNTKTGE